MDTGHKILRNHIFHTKDTTHYDPQKSFHFLCSFDIFILPHFSLSLVPGKNVEK